MRRARFPKANRRTAIFLDQPLSSDSRFSDRRSLEDFGSFGSGNALPILPPVEDYNQLADCVNANRKPPNFATSSGITLFAKGQNTVPDCENLVNRDICGFDCKAGSFSEQGETLTNLPYLSSFLQLTI
ncbi:MAG: hypothetical protein L0Y71_01795 [Gemmataceae bacterium]|nr:hypothetical protein [Gemmataceae bacterium]